MIIVISVAVTCSIVVILNIVMFFRDLQFKRRFKNNIHSKIDNLCDDYYFLTQDVDKLKSNSENFKSELMNLHNMLMDFKVESSTDSLNNNKRFKDLDAKVDLMLLSVRNIQDSFLSKEEGC